jgi:hypothetical protein
MKSNLKKFIKSEYNRHPQGRGILPIILFYRKYHSELKEAFSAFETGTF